MDATTNGVPRTWWSFRALSWDSTRVNQELLSKWLCDDCHVVCSKKSNRAWFKGIAVGEISLHLKVFIIILMISFKSISQSVSQSLNQSVNSYRNQSVNQLVNHSISQSLNQSIYHSIKNKLIGISWLNQSAR